MVPKIKVDTSFQDLIRYYDGMTDKVKSNIQKKYLKTVASPHAIAFSSLIRSLFPVSGHRAYGVTRTTTGRLFRAGNNARKVHAKTVKGETERIIAYFYIPKGKEVMRKKNGYMLPFPNTYSAWISYGTRSHTIRKNDIRGANIVSRINYYKEKLMKLEQKLYSLPKSSAIAKTKTQQRYEYSLERYTSLIDRLSHAQTQGNAKGIVRGISKRKFIQTARDKINMQGSQELSNLIIKDLQEYFVQQPSIIGNYTKKK